jgi:hypothetical protein
MVEAEIVEETPRKTGPPPAQPALFSTGFPIILMFVVAAGGPTVMSIVAMAITVWLGFSVIFVIVALTQSRFRVPCGKNLFLFGFASVSYIIGMCFHFVQTIWGTWVAILGFIFGFVPVIPMALIACLIEGQIRAVVTILVNLLIAWIALFVGGEMAGRIWTRKP